MTDINVLGFELEAAVLLLTAKGFEVKTQEVRSRKGLIGNERRVVRQRRLPEELGRPKSILLTYAEFQTSVVTTQAQD
ncbi:hypothetical protein LJC42_05170 [Eubacteriales bacterium OttesenSCG-928-K08]|nr:hypothetical protein [Eubacteriales bacterium OttesenSCG-928-K08]